MKLIFAPALVAALLLASPAASQTLKAKGVEPSG
jgi:hypothetical protein